MQKNENESTYRSNADMDPGMPSCDNYQTNQSIAWSAVDHKRKFRSLPAFVPDSQIYAV